jgi:hypothetical protein
MFERRSFIATNRKIGLEFVKQYLALGCLAARRKPEEAFESKTPAKKNSDSVDVLALVFKILRILVDGRPINLLTTRRSTGKQIF